MKTNNSLKIIILTLTAIIAILVVSIVLIVSCSGKEDNDFDSDSNDSTINFPFWSEDTKSDFGDESNDKNDGNILDNNQQDLPFATTEIELEKFVKLDFEEPGYNGYGVPELSFDENYLSQRFQSR